MEKEELGLLLGQDEEENNQAEELVRSLEEWYDVGVQATAGIPFFEHHWHMPLPSVHVEPPPTMGGGGAYGLQGIANFVRLELENRSNGRPP